jgi:hypothetical protein
VSDQVPHPYNHYNHIIQTKQPNRRKPCHLFQTEVIQYLLFSLPSCYPACDDSSAALYKRPCQVLIRSNFHIQSN